ncbi:twin-arginine translocase subunit TatC [soil metagenome]
MSILQKFSRARGTTTGEMPFFDHLEELRWRIIWSVLALIAGTAVGFMLATRLDLLGLLKRPLDPYIAGEQLIALSITEPFFITFKLALTLGIIFAAPVIIYQMWSFLAPALTKREKRAIVPALYLGVVLFCVGVVGAYFYVLPLTAKFLAGFQTESLKLTMTGGLYFGFAIKLLVAFGLVFQLPVVILILATLGLVSSKFLSSNRRFAIAGITIVAALVTPGDVASTILMMIPLMILYELSIILTRGVERGRARQAVADAAAEARAEAEYAAAEAGAEADATTAEVS